MEDLFEITKSDEEEEEEQEFQIKGWFGENSYLKTMVLTRVIARGGRSA